MADTNNRALEAFEAFMKTEAPSDYDASNGDAWYVWKACWAAALASRHAEVDDEGLRLLRTILAGDVGQQTLGKLARGQSTETEDGKAWLAAHKLITAP